MKIIKNQIKDKSTVSLIPNNSDDIYTLGKLLKVGDYVKSKTTRKISMSKGKTQQRISCILEVKIETIDIDIQFGIIEVKGKTLSAHEKVPQGVYHTISLTIDQLLTLTKDKWTGLDMKNIKGDKIFSNKIIIVVFYDRDCVISKQNGKETVILNKYESKASSFKNILKAVLNVKGTINKYIFTGVSDMCNKFFNEFRGNFGKNTFCFKLSSSDYGGLPNSRLIGKMIEDDRYKIYFSTEKIDEKSSSISDFIEDFKKLNDKIVFGWIELKEAFDFSALVSIYMTDKLYKPNDMVKRKKMESFIQKMMRNNIKINVIPLCTENGYELEKLGGIGGRIKYKYK